MCGIVGFVRKGNAIMNSNLRAMETLIYLDTLRGSCATGWGGLDMDTKEIMVEKRALAGPDFLRTYQWERLERRISRLQLVIGHNRAATTGSADKDENAHPFHFKGEAGDILLVHNGTIHNHRDVTRQLVDFNHQVDSAHIAYSMAHRGEQETLNAIRGGFVLVWYNKTNNTFNIARNHMRDISWVLDDGGNIWFASEFIMLDLALQRNNINLPSTNPERDYESVDEMEWWSWDLATEASFATPTRKNKIVHYEPPKQESRRESRDSSNYGWGATREKVKDKLEAFGFLAGEEIECFFHPESWQPYTPKAYTRNGTQERGRLLGSTITIQQYMPVVVHNIAEKYWTENQEIFIEHGAVCVVDGLASIDGDDTLVVTIDEKATDDKVSSNLLKLERSSPKAQEVLRFPTAFRGPSGAFVSRETFVRLVKDGCVNCSSTILPEHANDILWVQGAEPAGALCPACSANPQTRALAVITLKDIRKAGM